MPRRRPKSHSIALPAAVIAAVVYVVWRYQIRWAAYLLMGLWVVSFLVNMAILIRMWLSSAKPADKWFAAIAFLILAAIGAFFAICRP
jgi:hypothetical protein